MKLSRHHLHWSHTRSMLLVVLCCVGAGCSSSRLSSRNLSDDYFSSAPRPQVESTVWHVNDSVSRIFWSINPASLLFKSSDAGFQAVCEVKLIQYLSYSSGSGSDTLAVVRTYLRDSSQVLLDSVDVPMRRGQNRIFSMAWRDQNRGVVTTAVQWVNKQEFSSEDLLFTAANGAILFNREVAPLVPFTIRSSQPSHSWKAKAYLKPYPVAVPPFVNAGVEKYSLKPDTVMVLTPDENGAFNLPSSGMYLLSPESLPRSGVVLQSFTEDFPAITRASEMLPPLRYLTTTKEFNEMKAMPTDKAAMDHFWLLTGGNKEVARDLIRSFYQRVATANTLFTSYIEGWKSDRGMIYIVFGPPQSVYRSDEEETWSYDNGPNRPDLRFTFRKVNNPFTSNDYNLDRSPIFEQAWYMAVDAWRQGRIFND